MPSRGSENQVRMAETESQRGEGKEAGSLGNLASLRASHSSWKTPQCGKAKQHFHKCLAPREASVLLPLFLLHKLTL